MNCVITSYSIHYTKLYDGKFVDEGTTLQGKIEKNIQIAVKMGMPESKAREQAETILPTLGRWK